MDFRDRDGEPLITWHDAESAFEAWKALLAPAGRATTPGSPTTGCAAAAASSGRAPTTRPDGTERLYTDGRFNTDPDYCETYGHDLATGAAVHRASEYRAMEPRRAGLPRTPPTTSRRPRCPTTSTRCCSPPAAPSTSSTPAPRPAARRSSTPPRPTCGSSSSAADAAALGIAEGDLVAVESRARRDRGAGPDRRHPPGRRVRPVPLRLLGRRTAGDDRDAARGQRADHHRLGPGLQAAVFKVAAVRVAKLADGGGTPSPAPTDGGLGTGRRDVRAADRRRRGAPRRPRPMEV